MYNSNVIIIDSHTKVGPFRVRGMLDDSFPYGFDYIFTINSDLIFLFMSRVLTIIILVLLIKMLVYLVDFVRGTVDPPHLVKTI